MKFAAAILSKRPVQVSIMALAVFVVSCLFYSQFYDYLYFVIYQSRDIDRISQLCTGQFISFGPETSGGGNLLGSFYYYMMAPAYCLGGWKFAWYFYLGLTALSATFVWWALFHFSGWMLAALGLYTWLSSTFITSNLLTYLNPAPMNLLLTLSLAGLIYFLKTNHQLGKRIYFASILLAGLSTQVHGSSYFLLAGLILFLAFNSKNLAAQGKLKAFSLGIPLFFVPHFFAFLIFHLFESDLPPTYDPPSSLFGWVEKLAVWQKNSFWERQGDFANFFKDSSLLIFNSLSIQITLVFCLAYLAVRKRLKLFFVSVKQDKYLLLISACLMAASLPGLLLMASSGIVFVRYGLFFHLCHIFLVLLLLHHILFVDKQIQNEFIWLLSASAVVWTLLEIPQLNNFLGEATFLAAGLSLFAVTDWLIKKNRSIRFSFKTHILIFTLSLLFLVFNNAYFANSKPYMATSNLEQVSKTVKDLTDWNFETLKKKTYTIGMLATVDFEPIYREIPSAGPNDLAVDGLILVHSPNQSKQDQFDAYLQNKYLPNPLLNIFAADPIEWVSPQIIGDFFVLPYKFTNEEPRFENIHNFGLSYYNYQELSLIESLPKEQSGSFQPDTNNLILFWRCPFLVDDCTTAIQIKQLNSNKFSLEIIGKPLSQNSRWTQPFWTEAWGKTSLEYKCDDETKSVTLFDAIGTNFQIKGQDAHTELLAPVKRLVETDCQVDLKSLSVSIENLIIYSSGYVEPKLGFRRFSTTNLK